MRFFCFLIFLLTGSIALCQVPKNDTIWYSYKNINYIKIYKSVKFNSEIRYYKKSKNLYDLNKPLIDTVYRNDIANKENWSYYEGTVKKYLHNNNSLNIQKNTKSGQRTDTIFRQIKGTYCYYLEDAFNLQLCLSYNNDSLIDYISLEQIDTTKSWDNHTKLFFINRFNKQTGIILGNGEYDNIYTCGELGTLIIKCKNKNVIEKLIFSFNSKENNSIQLTMYDNYSCKTFEYLKNGVNFGSYYEYYENGNLKCKGEYGFKIGNEKIEKIGKWIYFNEDGSIKSHN